MSDKAIWKFPLLLIDAPQLVMMPEGAEILTAQMQGNSVCVWALVNTKAPTERRFFEIAGTGNRMPDANRRYVSTTQSGPLVWHVFERL